MLLIAQRTSNYKANPFAVAQEKRDKTTILDFCNKVYILKKQQRKKQANNKNPQDAILCLTKYKSNIALLPPCQTLGKLPEICNYWAYKGKQHKLIQPDNRLVREKVAPLFNLPYSLTGFFSESFFLLLFSSFTPR